MGHPTKNEGVCSEGMKPSEDVRKSVSVSQSLVNQNGLLS